jgi:hypothetical protein
MLRQVLQAPQSNQASLCKDTALKWWQVELMRWSPRWDRREETWGTMEENGRKRSGGQRQLPGDHLPQRRELRRVVKARWHKDGGELQGVRKVTGGSLTPHPGSSGAAGDQQVTWPVK